MCASLSGEVAGSYSGTGDFLSQTDRIEGPRQMFSLISQSDSLGSERFKFYLHNGTRPPVGRYPLQLIDLTDWSAHGFSAIYTRRDEHDFGYYAAETGFVEITVSTEDRVEGTFYLVGRQFCVGKRIDPNPQPCANSWEPSPTAPTVEIQGSFSAVPFDSTVDY